MITRPCATAFRLALLALVVVCLPLRPTELSAQTTLTTLKLGIVPAVVSVQAYVAQEFGIFKKHGLDVQFFPTSAGVNTISALVGGSLDLAFGDAVAVSSAHVHNIPLKFVAPGIIDTAKVPVMAVLVKPGGTIREAKDLDGKTISVNAIRSMATVMTSAWVDGNGGDSKTLSFVELPFTQTAAAVTNGTVDAGLTAEPFITSAADGGLRIMQYEQGAVHDYLVSGWIATPAWLAANPDTAAKFIASIQEATEYANKQPVPDDVADVLSKYTKLPAATIAHMKYPDLFGTTLDVRYVQRVVDAAAKYGVIDKPFPAAEIVYQTK